VWRDSTSPHHGILNHHQHLAQYDQHVPLVVAQDLSRTYLPHPASYHDYDSDGSSIGGSPTHEYRDPTCCGLFEDPEEHPQGGRRSSSFGAWFCLCSFATILLVGLIYAAFNLFAPKSEFDCSTGLQYASSSWSDLKKEWCCVHRGLACEGPGGGNTPGEQVPLWLTVYLSDMDLGAKFILSAMVLLLCGCLCGVWGAHQYLLKHAPHHQHPMSEADIEKEMQKGAKKMRCKADSEHEMAVTLMWDSKDDLDLKLRLPGDYGTVAVDQHAYEGFVVECDGNNCLARGGVKPLERIVFPIDERGRDIPPDGQYEVWVSLFEVHNLWKPPNFSVLVSLNGKKAWHAHLRFVPGQREVFIGTFNYKYVDRRPNPHRGHR